MVYRTHQGDMVDAICSHYYPKFPLEQAMTAVFEANPGLSEKGAILPEGMIIELPVLQIIDVEETIQLWD